MKYTVDELQSMAVQFLMAEQMGDYRCEQLKLRMEAEHGFPRETITARIHALAMRQAA